MIQTSDASKGEMRLAARLAVVQTLYSNKLSAQANVQNVAWLSEEHYQAVDSDFYQKLLALTIENHKMILALLLPSLQHRKWENLDLILQNLLICACAEMLGKLNDMPLIISIYCRISDGFYDDKMGKFVNGILQNCALKIADNADNLIS